MSQSVSHGIIIVDGHPIADVTAQATEDNAEAVALLEGKPAQYLAIGEIRAGYSDPAAQGLLQVVEDPDGTPEILFEGYVFGLDRVFRFGTDEAYTPMLVKRVNVPVKVTLAACGTPGVTGSVFVSAFLPPVREVGIY